MMLTLTRAEMLERWRLHHGLLPLSDSATVTATVPTVADSFHYAAIEEWYTRLLLTAPAHQIDPVDYGRRITLPAGADGGVTFTLPREALRLLSVRLMGWWCDARIISDPAEVNREARLQLDLYTRATESDPVALVRPGGFVTLYPAPDSPVAESILCAARHTDGTYRFEESSLPLDQIPTNNF
ncbi:MAG: hypothetical protein NC339_02520 [Muribaculaceae bacterium]|nr:hypothetical protein [Muribaculaceae bacterium]